MIIHFQIAHALENLCEGNPWLFEVNLLKYTQKFAGDLLRLALMTSLVRLLNMD